MTDRQRCTYCSDPATAYVVPSRGAYAVPVCGVCRHMLLGTPGSYDASEDGEVEEPRRRRRGGKGRFRQG